ncbi:MAG: hypothetical protein RIS47_627 [Bacteroidota bacterium]
MKNFKVQLAFLMLILTSLSSLAQTTIDAEIRPRSEYRSGYKGPLVETSDAAFLTLQRSRFNADYKTQLLNVHLSLQDARIWGNTDGKTNASKMELFEAWFSYLIRSGLTLQVGRQSLKYDDQRIFSPLNWSNTGLAHDMAILKFEHPFASVHLGLAYNNVSDTLANRAYTYTSKQNYKTMGFLWISKHFTPSTTLSLIAVCDAFEKKTNFKTLFPRYTVGGTFTYESDSSAWGLVVSGYKQSGKNPTKVYQDGLANLDAYLVGAKLSYKITPALKCKLGTDVYSGSAPDLDASSSHTFTRMYGLSHSLNGLMDFYTALPNQGLVNYFVGVECKFGKKMSAELVGHSFSLQKDFVYKTEKTNKNMGEELDLVLNYTVSKEIAIQAGYCRYFTNSSTKKYFKLEGKTQHTPEYAYVMFTVRPQLYKTPQIAN